MSPLHRSLHDFVDDNDDKQQEQKIPAKEAFVGVFGKDSDEEKEEIFADVPPFSSVVRRPLCLTRVEALLDSHVSDSEILFNDGLKKSARKSSLENCSTRSISSCNSRRSVSYGSIHVREFNRIVGDHPDASGGPPMSIGWDFIEKKPIAIDELHQNQNICFDEDIRDDEVFQRHLQQRHKNDDQDKKDDREGQHGTENKQNSDNDGEDSSYLQSSHQFTGGREQNLSRKASFCSRIPGEVRKEILRYGFQVPEEEIQRAECEAFRASKRREQTRRSLLRKDRIITALYCVGDTVMFRTGWRKKNGKK